MSAVAAAQVAIGLVGFVAILAAVALIFSSRPSPGTRSRLRQLLLEADITTLLDRRFTIERRVYRRHRIFGVFVVVGAFAGLGLIWAIRARQTSVVTLLNALGPFGLRVVALAGAVLGLMVLLAGAVLFLRPSALKGVEAHANRWFDPVAASTSSASVGRLVARAPRTTGLFLLAAGVVCLAAL